MKTISKDQRGIANVAIVLIILVLVIAGAGYYFVSKAGKKSTLLKTEDQKTANEACMKVINDEDQCLFFAANNSSEEENMTIVMTGKQGQETYTWTVAYDGKGNSHTKMSGKDMSTETIMLNGDSYIKSGNANSWTKYPKGEDDNDFLSESSTPFDNNDFNFDYNKDRLQSAGKEKCGDLNCFKYTYNDSQSDDGENIDYNWTIWFDDKDYKIRKIAGTGSDGSNFEMVYSYGGVSISEPSPVQAAPDFDNMSPEEIQKALQQQYGL